MIDEDNDITSTAKINKKENSTILTVQQ